MATYSPADFPDDCPFRYGDRVRVHLYTREGFLMGAITGTLYAREERVNVARTDDGKPVYKTLYWVKDIEGYRRPNPDVPGDFETVEEGWFAEQDLERLAPAETPTLPGFQMN